MPKYKPRNNLHRMLFEDLRLSFLDSPPQGWPSSYQASSEIFDALERARMELAVTGWATVHVFVPIRMSEDVVDFVFPLSRVDFWQLADRLSHQISRQATVDDVAEWMLCAIQVKHQLDQHWAATEIEKTFDGFVYRNENGHRFRSARQFCCNDKVDSRVGQPGEVLAASKCA